MTEVVKRVAYAIWLKKPGGSTLLPFHLQPDHDQYIKQARAAIGAMREPTEAMEIAAGRDNLRGDHYAPGEAWRIMIDEALR